MKNTTGEFELFITGNFLKFYNKKESTSFLIKEKADEKERQKSVYDFGCVDEYSKREMAVEVKRLFSKSKGDIQKIKRLVHRFVGIPLEGMIKGEYFLYLKNSKCLIRLNRQKRIALLGNAKDEILSLNDPGGHFKLKCCDDMSLLRYNEEGSGITAWPIDLSSADDREIVRMLDAALGKFVSDEMLNIVLLVELSSVARRVEIAALIEDLKNGFGPNSFEGKLKNFDLIDGIYHIAVDTDPVIAQVYPPDKVGEWGLFEGEDSIERREFMKWIASYLI